MVILHGLFVAATFFVGSLASCPYSTGTTLPEASQYRMVSANARPSRRHRHVLSGVRVHVLAYAETRGRRRPSSRSGLEPLERTRTARIFTLLSGQGDLHRRPRAGTPDAEATYLGQPQVLLEVGCVRVGPLKADADPSVSTATADVSSTAAVSAVIVKLKITGTLNSRCAAESISRLG